MKKLKKLLLSIIVTMFAIVTFGLSSIVSAANAGPIYLGIISLRSSGHSYQQGGKTVWKIAQYSSPTSPTADTSKTIYCIKAGPGFGSSDMSTGGVQTISTYTQKFDLKNKAEIPSPYIDVLPTGENYNKLLWVLDHLYIMPEAGKDNTENRNAFLANIIPDERYELLTDDDIDVIQQLAVWYFTNPTGDYHYENIELFINSTEGQDGNYKSLEDLYGDDGWDRQDAAEALYEYYIKGANASYTSGTVNSKPVELEKDNAKMQKIEDNYVAGPYKINKLLDVDYTISATYTDMDNKAITPTLGVKDENGNIVATNKTLKELEGTEFYLIMPVSSNITGIKMNITTSYKSRTLTYWSVENAPNTEQPVVIVEETPYSFADEASLIVPKPFDLSLRKFITAVNGIKLENENSRIPQVDVTALKNNTNTTATYNHPKTPERVTVGDIVEYTIRVYNEGEIDGYVEEITDHLPAQLEYIVDDEVNIENGWEFVSSSDLKTVKTSYLSKANETSTGSNKLAAFNGEELAYKDVKIRCKVVSTNPMASKITNIADISKFTDGDGNAVTDRDSQENNVVVPTGKELENYKDPEINRGEKYIPGQQDDDDFEKLIIKEFDLSLRKFITSVNDDEITNREPQVDVTALKNAAATTATYNHPKTPVRVTVGDTVEYTIRVYNEGEVNGYVEEITDHIPAQLEYLPENEVNKKYEWVMLDKDNNVTTDVSSAVKIKTNYLSKAKETTDRQNKIEAFDGKELDYKDVKIKFKVIETNPMATKITNIADITDFVNEKGEKVTDRDSQENNVVVPTGEELENYKDEEIGKEYIPGQQDDDDFEKLIIRKQEFDLSLRKFITAVNDTEITSRIPAVDTTALKNATATTATYTHPKDPVLVSNGNIVTYTIRVYNEGEIDGYAQKVKDDIPEGLEFLPDNETNKEYRWKLLDEDGNETEDVSKAKSIVTDYLSKEQEKTSGENLIKAFDENTGVLLYKDVKVAFKVTEPNSSDRIIINQAQISEDADKNGNDVDDRDSTPDKWIEGEDDQDIEKVRLQEFDLSLRKFITAVNDTEITSRIPVVDTTALKDGTATTATYTHPKDPVLVSNGNIVTYTIRVYNEGEIDGYAQKVKDDIPEGLEFLPDNETNKEYRWKLLDEDGNETEDVSKAKSIVTDYLSKEQEKTKGENLIKAFDKETGELSYKDVKVAFKVIEPSTSDRIIINQAQISEDADKNGNDVDDRDSTPDKWIEGEDDQDIEKIKVQYFDLALRKWVTQAIVIENGEEKITETGHKAEDDPEAIVKVDLKKSKIDQVTVKFRYKIRVTNEGTIAGYVKEIKDYIPDGLKFVAEDNPLWTQLEENIITTDQAKDILLQPGESTEVEVLLTWINGENNMKVMDNWAEISKDYNDYGSPDIDSTPDNRKHGEDDIDDAPVIITVQTGQMQVYVTISLSVLAIVGTGIVLIKKFVM